MASTIKFCGTYIQKMSQMQHSTSSQSLSSLANTFLFHSICIKISKPSSLLYSCARTSSTTKKPAHILKKKCNHFSPRLNKQKNCYSLPSPPRIKSKLDFMANRSLLYLGLAIPWPHPFQLPLAHYPKSGSFCPDVGRSFPRIQEAFPDQPTQTCPGQANPSLSTTLFIPWWLLSVCLPLLEKKLHKRKDLILLIYYNIPRV